MKFKDFYEIPKFKTLDKTGKVIFVFSFVLPIAIVYTFLHLYFLPFGLDQNYTLESKDVDFVNKDFFYTINEEEFLDGVAEIKVEPRLPKRNPFVTVSVEGEGSYITQYTIPNKDIVFNPDFAAEFNEDFVYAFLQEYNVKDEDILVFKIDYDVDWETQGDNELILKYKNMRVIQHHNSAEIRVDELMEGELKSYRTYFQFYSEDFVDPISLYAIYKKPNETNGFIEIVAKNRISRREIIPSLKKEHDEKIEELEIETVWHSELIKDFSQEFVSLKQEEYTWNLLEDLPVEVRDVIDSYAYYERIHKPEEFEKAEEIWNLLEKLPMEVRDVIDPYAYYERIHEPEGFEDGEDEEDAEIDFLVEEGDFRYEEDDPNKRYQNFYKKDFYNDFRGDISKLSVAYEYPIAQKKELKVLFSNTPVFVRIVGENSKIEDVKINLYRESVWKKL